jgi:transposase-like protein
VPVLVELILVEQRDAVMEVVSGGIAVVEVAERYGVSRKTVHAWLRRYRQDGLPGLAEDLHAMNPAPNYSPGQATPDPDATRVIQHSPRRNRVDCTECR